MSRDERYDPVFRPPGEADSLIVRVARGCPHNGCTFCGMYRGMPYRPRPLAEVFADIAHAARRAPGTRRVFLADGNAAALGAGPLTAILEELGRRFPRLARVSLYANGRSILALGAPALRALRERRLHTLYMGLESGDEETLRRAGKAETTAEMVAACRLAQEAGLRMSVMILIGLAGPARSAAHAGATAAALNAMQPRLLSALRLIPVLGTPLYTDLAAGRFRMLTEHEAMAELRRLASGLELDATVFRADHVSNVVPLEARFPRDKEALLAALDRLLASGRLDRNGPGRLPDML